MIRARPAAAILALARRAVNPFPLRKFAPSSAIARLCASAAGGEDNALAEQKRAALRLIGRARDHAEAAKALSWMQTLEAVEQDIGKPFILIPIGEFSCGKSTVVNALFRKELCEMGPRPITDKVHAMPELLWESIRVYDVPGTNSARHDAHTELQAGKLPHANCVVWLLNALQPIKNSEMLQIDSILKYKPEVIIFVNFWNKVDDDEKAETAEYIEDTFTEMFPEAKRLPLIYGDAKKALKHALGKSREGDAGFDKLGEEVRRAVQMGEPKKLDTAFSQVIVFAESLLAESASCVEDATNDIDRSHHGLRSFDEEVTQESAKYISDVQDVEKRFANANETVERLKGDAASAQRQEDTEIPELQKECDRAEKKVADLKETRSNIYRELTPKACWAGAAAGAASGAALGARIGFCAGPGGAGVGGSVGGVVGGLISHKFEVDRENARLADVRKRLSEIEGQIATEQTCFQALCKQLVERKERAAADVSIRGAKLSFAFEDRGRAEGLLAEKQDVLKDYQNKAAQQRRVMNVELEIARKRSENATQTHAVLHEILAEAKSGQLVCRGLCANTW